MWSNLNKRAQMAVFVILGLVILFSIIILAYMSYMNTKNQSEFAFREFSGPIDRGRIQTLVEGCIDLSSRPAIQRMAYQGGFLNIPVDEFYTPQIPVTGVHPRMVSPVVQLTSGKQYSAVVPYAYFNGENHFPALEEMESELSGYLEAEIPRCLDNFSAFNYDLTFAEKSPIEVSVKISEEKVSVNVDYEIEFKSKDKKRTFTFDVFRKEVPYRIGRLRELARQITNYQSESNFLENVTIEVLSFSGLPYEGLDFSCENKQWYVGELEEDFKPFMMYNLQYLKFKNTKFNTSEFYNDYYKKRFLVDFTNDDFSDVRVEAYYDDMWDLNLDVYPKENGNIVKPLKTGVQAYFVCINTYHHRYDFNFPVLIRLMDDYKGNVLTYNIALPVSIRKNKAFTNDLYVPYGHDKKEYLNEEYCTSDELLYGPVEIRAMDTETEDFISNVTVSYDCGFFLCDGIGKIDYPRIGNLRIAGKKPVFVGSLPECNGGYITLSAPGYETSKRQANTVLSDPSSSIGKLVVVEMTPKKDISYTVKIATDVNNPTYTRGLLKDEAAIIRITDQDDPSIETTVYYPTNISNYLTIPITKSHEERKYIFDVKIFKGNIDSKKPDDIFSGGLISGAFLLENVSFSYQDIDRSDNLIIYAVSREPGFSDTKDFYDYFQNQVTPLMANFKPVLQ